jgi:hypothetical protein
VEYFKSAGMGRKYHWMWVGYLARNRKGDSGKLSTVIK